LQSATGADTPAAVADPGSTVVESSPSVQTRISSSRSVLIADNVILRRLLSRPRPTKRLMLLGALALLASGCGGSSSHPTPPGPQAPRRAPLISMFEAPVQLASAPGPTLDLLRRLGVEYVRVFVRWSSLAPSPAAAAPPAGFNGASPAAYPAAGWAPYDALVREAARRGMGVMLGVGGPAPQWATGAGVPSGASGAPGAWKPSASEFGAFAHAVGARYSGHYTPAGASSPLPRVSFWSIWNEPNLGVNLAPEAIDNSTVEASPAMYRALADVGWSALRQTGHGGDTILIGELAPYGQSVGNNVPGNFGYMVPLRFVRALYCVDSSLHPLHGSAAAARGCPITAAASKRFASEHPVLFQASGYAVHPYPSAALPPNVQIPDEPDFANLATLPNLEHLLDSVTSTYGASKRFPLYSTEYGYFTDPPLSGAPSPPLAAAYLNWAEYISWHSPRIRSWDQYLLVDPPTGGASNFVTGLEFANGVPKPSYAAYRMPIYLPVTKAGAGQSLEVWGCVRPAHWVQHDTGAPQRAQVQLQTRAGAAFKTVKTVQITDPNGYFDINVPFTSSGSVRVAWSYPRGPTIYSRTVPITVA
jgi:hypothetical protein